MPRKSPQQYDMSAADPAHPDHRKPVWSARQICQWFGCTQSCLWRWVNRGVLGQPGRETTSTDGRIIRYWTPAAIVAATTTQRVPKLGARKARTR